MLGPTVTGMNDNDVVPKSPPPDYGPVEERSIGAVDAAVMFTVGTAATIAGAVIANKVTAPKAPPPPPPPPSADDILPG